MTLLDVNILVYAFREDAPDHRAYRRYLEGIAEVQTIKGVVPAEYGDALGGQVNIITKSGTNQWHGSLFENFQSQRLTDFEFQKDPRNSDPKRLLRCNAQVCSQGGDDGMINEIFRSTQTGSRSSSAVWSKSV